MACGELPPSTCIGSNSPTTTKGRANKYRLIPYTNVNRCYHRYVQIAHTGVHTNMQALATTIMHTVGTFETSLKVVTVRSDGQQQWEIDVDAKQRYGLPGCESVDTPTTKRLGTAGVAEKDAEIHRLRLKLAGIDRHGVPSRNETLGDLPRYE